MTENDYKKNLNLSDFIFQNIKYWYVTVSIVLISLLVTFVYTKFFITPTYTSISKLYIIDKNAENVSTSDFALSSYISSDFTKILFDTTVLDQVTEELDGKYTYNQIKSFSSVRQPEANSRIIEIVVNSPDPNDSKKIVDRISEYSRTELKEIMNLERIQIIKKGNVPEIPSNPNLTKNLLFMLLASLIASETIIVLLFIFNNKISSTEDIEKYLGLTVLASIPYNQTKNNNNPKGR